MHDTAFDAPVEKLGAVVRQVRRLLDGERLAPTQAWAQRPLRLATRARPALPIHLAALGPAAVRLTGELADGWYPFLLPLSALPDGIAALERAAAGRPTPLISPCLPVAVSPDPRTARSVAAWWVAFYLTSMGPLYRETLRRLGHGAAVDAVLAANPTPGSADVPVSAEVLLDELTVHGDAATARAALQRWYAAGAQTPVLALPPGRPVAELDHVLEALRPTEDPAPAAPKGKLLRSRTP